jgi:hypothetical protein
MRAQRAEDLLFMPFRGNRVTQMLVLRLLRSHQDDCGDATER